MSRKKMLEAFCDWKASVSIQDAYKYHKLLRPNTTVRKPESVNRKNGTGKRVSTVPARVSAKVLPSFLILATMRRKSTRAGPLVTLWSSSTTWIHRISIRTTMVRAGVDTHATCVNRLHRNSSAVNSPPEIWNAPLWMTGTGHSFLVPASWAQVLKSTGC